MICFRTIWIYDIIDLYSEKNPKIYILSFLLDAKMWPIILDLAAYLTIGELLHVFKNKIIVQNSQLA